MADTKDATSGSAGGKDKAKKPKKLPRLAPLDHVRNLYAGAATTLPQGKPRRIFYKKDLIAAVRHKSPVKVKKEEKKSEFVFSGPQGPPPMDTTTKTLKELETAVLHNSRRYNTLKMEADAKQRQLATMMDNLRALEVENKALLAIDSDATPDTQRILDLQKQIETVEHQMQKKVFQKKQLEFMTKRLRTNMGTFDSHIKSMDAALRASRKELIDVRNYLRLLENSKDKALQELHRYEEQLASEKQERMKELEERKGEAANARKMDAWRKDREAARAELAAEMRGDMSKEKEMHLLRTLEDKELEAEKLKSVSKEREAKALTLEDAFLQIKQATGVASLEAMVEKFLAQGDNRAALAEEKQRVENKLARVQRQKEEAEKEFAEMKATGIGGAELSREVYDKMDKEIAEAKATLKANRAAVERMENVLVAVRQGAVGLNQRLLPFGPLLDEDEASSDEDSGEELPLGGDVYKMLKGCEGKLLRMLEMMGRSPSRAGLDDDDVADRKRTISRQESVGTWVPPDESGVMLHPNNVRVSTHLTVNPDTGSVVVPASGMVEEDSDSDASEPQGDDPKRGGDIMDRHTIKKASRKKNAEEIRKRELAAKRAKMQAKIRLEMEKKEALSRLMDTVPEPVGLSFLINPPELL